MEKLNLKLTILILLFSISQFSFAQKSGQIKGIVSDGKTALEFTDVLLKNSNDSTKVASYMVTDISGNFSLDNLSTGEYQLLFKLIGYKTIVQKIKITDTNPIISLGTVVLQNDSNLLKAVVVTSQKKMIQKTSEGLIFNVGANISQIGGTATDLLKNIPTVAVDAEGAVSLRGKTPLILINGKNSAITNIDQIAASSIESIEVITNPTAKYDANAESGVINIKLKKNNQNGINGAVVLGAGFGAKGRINSSVLFNHKKEKWNFGLGYDNRFAGRTKKIKGSRTNYLITDEHFIEQNRNDERTEQLQNLKFNIDFSPNDKNTFSFEAIANKEGQDNDETLKTLIKKEDFSFFK
jgi:outer membrane receptor protein involved in Fe transport